MSRTAGRTGELHWTDTGPEERRVLLLLHSLGTGSAMWGEQIGPFSPVRRLVTVDLPGHGGSSAMAGEYRLEDLGRDVLAVAESAGVDHFDLCGISLGGLISLWLAANVPDRVLGLVASNTAAQVGTAELWSERIRAVSELGMEGVRPNVVPRFFTPDFPDRDPGTYRSIEATFASVDPVGYAGCCAALRDADLSGQVAQIRCPTLVLAGEEDVATPPSKAEWLHSRIAGSRLEVIPGAAHLANLDQPQAFNGLVLDFLA